MNEVAEQSEAAELLEHGQRYLRTSICKCEQCLSVRKEMKQRMRSDILDLAQEWAKASPTIIFCGLMEDWTVKQISEALNRE
jgi:hypothetical protein